MQKKNIIAFVIVTFILWFFIVHLTLKKIKKSLNSPAYNLLKINIIKELNREFIRIKPIIIKNFKEINFKKKFKYKILKNDKVLFNNLKDSNIKNYFFIKREINDFVIFIYKKRILKENIKSVLFNFRKIYFGAGMIYTLFLAFLYVLNVHFFNNRNRKKI